MVTCTVCGSDVTGKKFCPDCGAPAQPPQTAQVLCPACNGQLPASSVFCMHCGHKMSGPVTPQMILCAHCGHQSAPGTRFCGGCGQSLQPGAVTAAQSQYAPPPASGPYVQSPSASGPYTPVQTTSQYADPQSSYQQPYQPLQYSQPQYPQQQPQYPQSQPYTQSQYPQPQQYPQQPQYPQSQPYPQQPQYPQSQPYYGPGYQPQPMMGQQPMVLRCPTCMAMAAMGSANCVSCGTNLAGVVPTPANAQGQQGGLGSMLQGNGGKIAMGVLGGAAAVIGGEMLMHGIENSVEDSVEGDMGFGERRRHRRDEGGLLGELGKDIGLF